MKPSAKVTPPANGPVTNFGRGQVGGLTRKIVRERGLALNVFFGDPADRFYCWLLVY